MTAPWYAVGMTTTTAAIILLTYLMRTGDPVQTSVWSMLLLGSCLSAGQQLIVYLARVALLAAVMFTSTGWLPTLRVADVSGPKAVMLMSLAVAVLVMAQLRLDIKAEHRALAQLRSDATTEESR